MAEGDDQTVRCLWRASFGFCLPGDRKKSEERGFLGWDCSGTGVPELRCHLLGQEVGRVLISLFGWSEKSFIVYDHTNGVGEEYPLGLYAVHSQLVAR